MLASNTPQSVTESQLSTTPPPEAERAHIKYLTVAPVFGEAIERSFQEISITKFVF